MIPRRREDLPALCLEKGLHGTFVEIGVAGCDFSRNFIPLLGAGQIAVLVLVDPWTKESFWRPTTDAEMDAMYETACNLGKGHDTITPGKNLLVIRNTSAQAAASFVDGEIDFCFLDARHEYESVKQDIGLWIYKVRKGGILAVHDYHMAEVRRAVDKFFPAVNVCEDEEARTAWIQI